MQNRLQDSVSPYLLQHADNPVAWWPWCDEAFEEAKRRDVPVLLSVGYAACHWCHVMAHESFEDPETAAYLNEHMVAIKVDREERPDIDAVYMTATQAMTGQGGWPMTCVLTPAGEPFFCGTYFPDRPRHGMPAFRQVLEALVDAWRTRRDEIDRIGSEVVQQLRAGGPSASGTALGPAELDAAAALLRTQRDGQAGGFGTAPKFPPSMVLEFLLRQHARTGSETVLAMVDETCEAMARGGMYDQLGGGFARYSVDRDWVVPHFEKMLYDNALLLRVYLHWWHATGSPLGRRIAEETADFLLRELRTEQGGFASALDADSLDASGRSAEGAFYVWAPDQLRDVLGPEDASWAAELLTVTAAGTFEAGASTLQLRSDPDDTDRWASVRQRLMAKRDDRIRPGLDDKVVAAWNGLAVTALAEAGVGLERPDLVDAARRAGELLAAVHVDESDDGAAGEADPAVLWRTSRDGVRGTGAGVLDDYGCVAAGFLSLLGVTGDPIWLERAGALLDRALDVFGDGDGGFFDTASDAEALVLRPKDASDSATPSGTAALADALLSYAAVAGSDRHRAAAEAGLATAADLARQAPRFAGWTLAVAEAVVAGPEQIAVVGPDDDPGRGALHRAALRRSSPGAVVVAGRPDVAAVPLLAGRALVDGQSAAYVCRDFVCLRPETDPAAVVGSG
ncbi:MAG TPA: thioredoxin domain-containing protein [Nocardioidaceae bacterium]|nr:thioredoxin domain-containing protein [Nocardioidaceae bacterium]